MLKKLCVLLIIISIVSLSGMSVFAAYDNNIYRVVRDSGDNYLDNLIYGTTAQSTAQFLVTITRPDGDETTFNKSYVIAGLTDEKDVRVVISVYDEALGKYKALVNTDGFSSWDIGVSGVFAKEVALQKGANKIKIVAYKKSEENSLKVGTNVQVNIFTVTVMDESIKDKIVNSILRITDVFNKFDK